MPLMARIWPASEEGDGFGDWIRRGDCGCRRNRRGELRAADPTGVGLCVEAAVGGVVVLGLAVGAHFEARHRGLRAVVGDAAGDGVTRAAVGAVEEGIAVAAVGWSEQFAQAIGTGGGVGGNACGHAAEDFAGDDAEAGFAGGRDVADSDGVDAGKGRGLRAEASKKIIERGGATFDFNGDSAGIVSDAAGEAFFSGKAVDEGTKADTLHNAADADCVTLRRQFVRFSIWLSFVGQ